MPPPSVPVLFGMGMSISSTAAKPLSLVAGVQMCMSPWCALGRRGAGGISCIVIPKDAPGICFGAQERKMGWNSQPTSEVTFDDCRVPVENLVGEEGQGFKIAMKGLDGGRLNIGACSIGAARACLELAQDYTADRKQFGKAIGSFQAVQFAIADMATELEAARLMIGKRQQSLIQKILKPPCFALWLKGLPLMLDLRFAMNPCNFMAVMGI